MMLTRFIIASATVVALGTPAVQASPLHFLFGLCGHAKQTQCAIQLDRGDNNNATTVQFMNARGHQFALTVQKGDNNNAYTGQKGTDDFALTFQKGDNNTAGTHQEGADLASVTVQNGNGMWHTTGMAGDGGAVVSYQAN
jgi:hypothetical protein